MNEKKVLKLDSPNLNKLQAVKIDNKTIIYIALDEDPVIAKKRFLDKLSRNSSSEKG